jgi:hypothetical protein
MATRLIGTDSTNPRLPAVVIAATQGTTAADLAPGDVLLDAQAYTDAAIADVEVGGVDFATTAETLTGTATTQAVTPAGRAAASTDIDPRAYGFSTAATGAVNSAALQAAIDEACGTGNPVTTTRSAGRRIVLPAGLYLLGAQINIRSVLGLEIVGAGNCELRADTNMTAVFDINGMAYSHLGGFTITGTTGVQVDNVIHTYWTVAGAQRTNHSNSYHDLTIRDLDYITGIRVGVLAATGQVDNDEYRNISIAGAWATGETARYQYGIYFGTGTSGNNLVHHAYKLTLSHNRWHIYIDATQVSVFGAGFDGSEVDIRFGTTGYASLHSVRSEEATRFITTAGPAAVAPMISVSDVLWDAGSLNADGVWINMTVAGVLYLRNVAMYGATVTPKMALGLSTYPIRVIIDGLLIRGSASPYAPESLFTFTSSASTVSMRGYTAMQSGGLVNHVQDWDGPSTNAQTGTSYTFVQRDAHIPVVTFSNAAAITATIPPNSSVPFRIGARLRGIQLGAGTLSFAAGSGVTVNGTVASPGQYRQLAAIKVATDTWVCGVDV